MTSWKREKPGTDAIYYATSGFGGGPFHSILMFFNIR